jgi:hypothetical protein
MSFWKSQTGIAIDGSAKNAHIAQFENIPNGTMAPAMIERAELSEYNGTDFYQISYKLIDGDFKNRKVRQKIKCFDTKPATRDRGVNMLMRLYSLCDVKPSGDNAPTNDEMAVFQGKLIGVRIDEWFSDDGKEGNYISELHALDEHFVIETGVKKEIKPLKNHTDYQSYTDLIDDSALSRNKIQPTNLDDDIPF